jgi:D-glycero-D-manno-heptose 1,7-bisphosphate phosphatase
MTRPVTIRQCAILAGGLATRLGTITHEIPKPVLEVGERPFLAWLMRELQRFGVEEFVILTGHLSGRVQDIMGDATASLPKPARVIYTEEPVRAGTAGALHHARAHLHEHFLLCNGDSVFDTNLSALLRDAAHDGADVLGRLMLADLDDASRYGVVNLDGDRITDFAERRAAGQPGVINAGIYLLNRRIVDRCPEVGSLERDVLPALAAEGALRGTQGRGFFVDIGVPEDLDRARLKLPAVLNRPALFLDRDGVLNHDHGYVGFREHFDWVDGALDTIKLATDLGWHVFVVTNQSGVARGLYTEHDAKSLLHWVSEEARRHGGTVDDWRYCPYHPEGTVPEYRRHSDWRKPGPGMLLSLIDDWQLQPGRCLMVGDQPTDVDAATAAGMRSATFHGGNLRDFVAPLLVG